MDRVIYQFSDGSTAEFDVKREVCAVSIFALTADNHVIVVDQFRPGPSSYVVDLPGGRIDPGEEPMETARRELLEETGYGGTLSYLNTGFWSGYSNGKAYRFVATGCVLLGKTEHEEGEHIRAVRLLPLDDFIELLSQGAICEPVAAYEGMRRLNLFR